MEIAEFFATFGGGVFTFVIFAIVIISVVKSAKAKSDQQRTQQTMAQFKQRNAERQGQQTSSDEESRRQAEKMKQIAQSFGLYNDADEQARKHAKHVADSHAHEHIGEEEHYEEIVGSLGEVNDEGCADLSGVRFLANDIAYEIQTNEAADYDRLAQAIVLGEIVNSPRFKTPYTRKK